MNIHDSTKDQTELESLYRRFQPALQHFASGILKNQNDAAEIVHDVFLAVWEKREYLSLDQGLKSYLFRAVKNRCLNQLKRPTLPWADLDNTLPPAPEPVHFSEQLNAEETERIIFRIVEKLPPRCRQIFLLSRLEQLSYKEIAELMDISTKTVENQMTIALRFIRESLYGSKGGGNLHGTTLKRFLY